MLRQAGINRREVVQSRVLTVVEVMALESFLIAGVGNKYDLYAAGVFLFLCTLEQESVTSDSSTPLPLM